MARQDKKCRTWLWIALALVAVVFVVGIGSGGDGGSGLANEPTPGRDEYDSDGQELDYRTAMLGDYDTGVLLVTRGEVTQVFRDTNVLVDTEYDETWGYSGNKVWLIFEERPRLLEGDEITVRARYDGTQKYDSAMGTEKELPLLIADYVDVVE